jgi:hypothetical protein
MLVGLTSIIYWSCVARVSMSLGLTSVLYACCLFLLFWFCFTFMFEIVLLFTADITFSGRSLPSDEINLYLDSCFFKTNIKMCI